MNLTRRVIGTVGTIALAGSALAVLPAAGAATGPAAYACTSTETGAFTAAVEVDGTPDVLAAGAPIAVTTKITLPAEVRQTLYAAGGRGVEGTAQLDVAGTSAADPKLVTHTVARVPLENAGPVTLTGLGTLTLTQAGDVALTAGALRPTLQLFAGGDPVGTPVALSCVAPVPAPAIDTVSVTATSTTALVVEPVKAPYGEKILSRATVTTTGGPAKGAVVFTLGTVTRRATVKADGTAETTLPATVSAKQTHTVTATFEPTDVKNVAPSTMTKTVTVGKDSTNVRVTVGRTQIGRAVKAVVTINSVHGATVNGRVQLILKRDGKTLRSKTKSLKKEKRTVWLVPVYRLGRATVQVKYLGQPDFKKSNDSVTFYVVRR